MNDPEVDRNGGTVLVVDDDPQELRLLIGVLEEEGYQVQPADSGKLALVSMAAQPPDLVLLDVKMPVLDGFEVCRRMKETEAGRRVPVMFISGSREPDQLVEGLSLGAVDFIGKPFHREELLARVRTHVELRRLQANLETLVTQRTAELRNVIEQLQLEVAERRRVEQALRESEWRYREITNTAPVIIWTSGTDHHIDSRNEYAEAFTGRCKQDLIGDRWDELVHPDDLEMQHEGFLRGVQTGNNFQLEYRIRRADGEYRWMLDKGTPRFLPNGEFAGYVGTVFDVTDVKLNQERAFREKNLENLRVLSAGIAHDFNTLLGSIFGEVDLALSDMPEDSPGRENMVRIDAVAKRAAEVVRLLLAYVGEPSNCPEPEMADLTAVVGEIVPHLKGAVVKKADIQTSLARRLPSVQVNLLQIRLVILNLIINAVESLDGKRGRVMVTTSRLDLRPDSPMESRLDLPDGLYVKLEVSDTGQGMTDELQDRIFDPYYTTKSMGRGLGLAAVQGIVRSHHGAIRARSEPGGGSTFEVVLPTIGHALGNMSAG